MKIANRTILIAELPDRAFTFVRALSCLVRVSRPISCLRHYIRRSSPEHIDLRGGKRILLSSHPHDLTTFFVVFGKKDYGSVGKKSVVIDVGANVGIFSLYAALSGASKVYAFEPSQESFETLCENIRINGLERIIVPFNRAVSALDNETVSFPRASNPCNRVGGSQAAGGGDVCHEVRTINLNTFIAQNRISSVDLLKMDCEGSEFEIIPSLSEMATERIREIRMECHGNALPLITHLNRSGYAVCRNKTQDLWFRKS